MSALIHTLRIALMLMTVTILFNLLFEWIGVENLNNTFLHRPILGDALLALFGLIPNCSISVLLTEAWLNGVISTGGLFSGLLSNAGVGLLVLIRTNKNARENLITIVTMFLLSFVTGSILSLAL